jgi:hypothetical protein
MDKEIDRSLLEAYGRGEISRREISDRMQMEVGFGDLLAAFHANGLPLPRFPSHSDSVGVKLIKRVAERAAAARLRRVRRRRAERRLRRGEPSNGHAERRA